MSDKRDAYVEKMKARLDGWNAEIDKLEARARQAQADAKVDYQEQIDALKEKRQKLTEQFDDLRRTGGDAWEDMKAGLENAADSMSEALHSARSRFN